MKSGKHICPYCEIDIEIACTCHKIKNHKGTRKQYYCALLPEYRNLESPCYSMYAPEIPLPSLSEDMRKRL